MTAVPMQLLVARLLQATLARLEDGELALPKHSPNEARTCYGKDGAETTTKADERDKAGGDDSGRRESFCY